MFASLSSRAYTDGRTVIFHFIEVMVFVRVIHSGVRFTKELAIFSHGKLFHEQKFITISLCLLRFYSHLFELLLSL